MRSTIVIPCYNEARRLSPGPFASFLREQPSVSLLFVDDGSTDDTPRLLHGIEANLGRQVRLVALPANRGKAEAVRAGVAAALTDHPEVVGYLDADLATPLAEVPRLIRTLLASDARQIVLGSRIACMGRRIRRRALRHYLGRIIATAASHTLGLPVYDTQCGAKVFRTTPEVRRIFDEPFTVRWTFDVELLARWLVQFRGRPSFDPHEYLVEHPLTEWTDVAGSKVRPRDFFVAFRELARIRRRYDLDWLGRVSG